MEVYGASVADKLDRGRGLLRRRYFRQHCTVDYSAFHLLTIIERI